jgi:hypothetical protein
MTYFERFARALAATESDDCEVAWGDPKTAEHVTYFKSEQGVSTIKGAQFMACGRWQIHPAWYQDWAKGGVSVGDSWDQAFKLALFAFWQRMDKIGAAPLKAAMIFHLGASAAAQGKWDEEYAQRFEKNYAALGVPPAG